MNNKLYYDELSTMSLILCNALENQDESHALNNLPELLTKIGMVNNLVNDDAVVSSNCKCHFVSATNDIEYAHNSGEEALSKKVKLVIIKSIDQGLDSIADIGTNDAGNNHEVFDKLANKIYEKVKDNTTNVYWVVGYNTGGAVANVLSAKLIDNNSIVYAYTFGSPYTVYNNSDSNSMLNPLETKYACIYNVVNDEDMYCYIPTNDTGFAMYGAQGVLNGHRATKLISSIDGNVPYDYDGNKRMRQRVQVMLNNIFNDKENLRNEYYENLEKAPTFAKRTHHDLLKEIYNEFRQNGNAKIVLNKLRKKTYLKNNQEMSKKYIKFITQLNGLLTNTYFKGSCDTGIYYIISKTITPETITFTASNYQHESGDTYDDTMIEILAIQNEDVKSMVDDPIVWGFDSTLTLKDAIELMAKWYINNVYTYGNEKKYTEFVKAENVKNTRAYKWYILDKLFEFTKETGIVDIVGGNFNLIDDGKTKTAGRGGYTFNGKYYEYAFDGANAETGLLGDTIGFIKASIQAIANNRTYTTNAKKNVRYYNGCDYLNSFNGDFGRAGDDCTRFAMSVFEYFLGKDANTFANYGGGSGQFVNDDLDIAAKMYNSGFDIYDTDNTKTIKNGNKIITPKKIDSQFNLKAGDFITRNGHVHFIVGETDSNNNVDNFGWGSVQSAYPDNYEFYVDKDNCCIIGDGKEYNRLYRYTGEHKKGN